MPSAATIRCQIEAALAHRIPSALTPAPKIIRPVAATGIQVLDEVLEGGLPLGAITELVGPECSGRTSLALSFIARITQAAKVCAWVDVSDALQPESAAAAGVDLRRLLWVRCGVSSAHKTSKSQNSFVLPEKYLIPAQIVKGLHGGGFGPHPRGEVKGIADVIPSLFETEETARRYVEPQGKVRTEQAPFESSPSQSRSNHKKVAPSKKPWSKLDQALRVTDLLLQGGGFSSIVLDMGSIQPEFASRVPLATWFRYRAAAEQSQTSILLLTQHACAKSSAGLVLHFEPSQVLREEATVFTGIDHKVEVGRERFKPDPSNVISLRKAPQSERTAGWHSRTTWAGRR